MLIKTGYPNLLHGCDLLGLFLFLTRRIINESSPFSSIVQFSFYLISFFLRCLQTLLVHFFLSILLIACCGTMTPHAIDYGKAYKNVCVGDGRELERALDDVFGI